MSNLSDLLPAGAGAKSADFVASGTLGSGQTVVLNSNGTVSVVAETSIPQAIGTKTPYSNGQVVYQSAVYSPTSNKIVILYADYGNSQYGRGIVGTVSGNSITFGTPADFNTNATTYISGVFDSTFNQIIVAFRASSGSGQTVIGTISGNSISFTSPVTFAPSFYQGSLAIDSVNNKVVASWGDSTNSYYGTAIAGSFSGSAITWGTSSIFQSSTTYNTNVIYVPPNDKFLITYYNVTSGSGGKASVATVSGTSITFGSASVFLTSNNSLNGKSVFDSTNNKIVTTWQDTSTNAGYGNVGTITGTSISYGSPVQFNATVDSPFPIYDAVSEKIYITFADATNSNRGSFILGSVSGSSISFSGKTEFITTDIYQSASAYDSTSNKMVTSFRDNALTKGSAVVVQLASTSTNNTSFIGITDQAIASGASGKVVVQGGVSEKVTGLTANTDYYVQSDGSISTTVSSVPAGKALSSTSILLKG